MINGINSDSRSRVIETSGPVPLPLKRLKTGEIDTGCSKAGIEVRTRLEMVLLPVGYVWIIAPRLPSPHSPRSVVQDLSQEN